MPVLTRGETSILYVHVPKTGGSSVEAAFRRAGWDVTYVDGNPRKHAPNWYRRTSPQHMHADLLAATFRLERFNAVFMTVREPLARFRSEYVMRNPQGRKLDEVSVEEWARQRFSAHHRDPFVLDNHLRPQNEFYIPGSDVYHLEDGLGSMLSHLGETSGIELPTEMPHDMQGGHGNGFSSRDVEISDSLRRTLHAFYAQDYQLFGYERREEP